jgi:large subunit ribosomal protein L15
MLSIHRISESYKFLLYSVYSTDNRELGMPHKKRKTRKKRGSRTHGYGQVGQHRGGGQRGGHGKAGGKKHKWTHTVKYAPERFGKYGFKPPRRREISAINVGELDQKISQLTANKKAKKTKGGIKLDLDKLGYDKLLGRGQVTQPLIIHVDSHSESAARKIEEAGGKVIKLE